MTEPIFPAIPQPKMDVGYPVGAQPARAILDNRTGLSDAEVMQVTMDRWVELAGLQFAQPTTFQLYANNYQSSMLARTPFKTPTSVIDEIILARSVADTDDDVKATIGQMLAVAFGEGVQNHHRDEQTLQFFNLMTDATALDLESILEEMYRELLIASSVTTLTLFTRKRMSYFPLKSDTAIEQQLQIPHVAILPAENLRVITNDVMNNAELAFYTEEPNFKRWLDEYFDPTTPATKRAIMAMREPVLAALFIGVYRVPFDDGDINSRGRKLYLLNQKMVHRTSLPKGALPYARPILTADFALLEAKRLLNLMDYALLQGGTNYIVVAKKGTDNLPAQPGEIDNLVNQVSHASRSGVMVGDHRLSIEVITPDLKELLNPAKRQLLGRKIAMGLLRQTEQVTGDAGTQGAVNEMEMLSRVVASDRGKILRHAQATFYKDTADRNRSVFKQGAPTIWAPKIILAGAKDFWTQVLNARDRGDIPRRWAVEALGFNYDAGLAEREREIKRGDDTILEPASVPFSNPGEPQDNGGGRPPGSSSNNGGSRDSPGPARARPRRTIQKNAGETIKAIVEDNEVSYIGETTLALFEGAEGIEFSAYVRAPEREAIRTDLPIRSGQSITVPVNQEHTCDEYRAAKLGDGLRVIVGQRRSDDAVVVRAIRFSEPQFDLKRANEYALRWGFISEPLVEHAAKRKCQGCGNELPSYSSELPFCPSCGMDNSMPYGGSGAGTGDADVA